MRARSLLLCLVVSSSIIHAQITATDDVTINNWKYITVQTPTATYRYCKEGGGFNNIFCKDNKDWIGCGNNPCGYNGIPNLVYPADYFHPGRKNCTTTLTSKSSTKVVITSKSKNGAWEVRWDIFETHATMHLIKKGPEKYWFLYEGTPYGRYDTKKDYWMSSDHSTRQVFGVSNAWKGDLSGLEWAVFGDPDANRVLFCLHHEQDNLEDTNWGDGCLPAGCGAMTVFGFGRAGNSCQMSAVPQTFSIGFLETTDWNAIRKRMEEIASGATGVPSSRSMKNPESISYRIARNGAEVFLPREGPFHIVITRPDGKIVETAQGTGRTATVLSGVRPGGTLLVMRVMSEGAMTTQRLVF